MTPEELSRYCDGKAYVVHMKRGTPAFTAKSIRREGSQFVFELAVLDHGPSGPVNAEDVESVLPAPEIPSFSSRT
jgi:hypothetical protein